MTHRADGKRRPSGTERPIIGGETPIPKVPTSLERGQTPTAKVPPPPAEKGLTPPPKTPPPTQKK
jgi:hypothetical protein